MKLLKSIGWFLISVIVVTTILSLILPVKQRIKRSVTINAPVAQVYQLLSKLENFNKWAVWNLHDSSIKNIMTGTDGKVGAINSWVGDPAISGEGKIEITKLENNKSVGYNIIFIKPKKINAESDFELENVNGQTKLNWQFDLATPRPWNIFNLFSSLDSKMGKDFDDGLANLKALLEKKSGASLPVTVYEVKEMNFPSSSFAICRQQIKQSEMQTFFADHLPHIYNEVIKANVSPGTASGLFYKWDTLSQQTDLAAAVIVPDGTMIADTSIKVINIPASKALLINYYGAYDKMTAAYSVLYKYLSVNNLKQKTPSLEQYITGPQQEKDSTKWLTKIIFLVE
ncbi:MAG: SRPBCC family protein [Chitinophagales bacterium]